MSEKVKNKEADPAAVSSDPALETALEDTFPASDPPASTQPGKPSDQSEAPSSKGAPKPV